MMKSAQYLLGPALLAAIALPVHAQSPCDWDRAIGIPGANSPAIGSGQELEVTAILAADLLRSEPVEVYAGGIFWTMGEFEPFDNETEFANGIARWDGSQWHLMGYGLDIVRDDIFGELLAEVKDMVVYEARGKNELYVGGNFDYAFNGPRNGVFVGNLARWNGHSWASVGGGLGEFGAVFALAVFDAGNGPALFAAGDIRQMWGSPVDSIGQWRSTGWTGLGGRFENDTIIEAGWGLPITMVVFDDGTGPALYVGGRFDEAPGNVPALNIAKWDGQQWSQVGGGLGVGPTTRDQGVFALYVHDDGTGPALYAGGRFDFAGGAPANNIAKWDGVSWSPLGDGLQAIDVSTLPGGVKSLATFQSQLWVGGQFEPPIPQLPCATGEPKHLAVWDGAAWSVPEVRGVVGNTRVPQKQPGVFELTPLTDGVGDALYIGGMFNLVGCSTSLARNPGPNGIATIRCP